MTEPAAEESRKTRSTFGPVVLLGLATAGLTAVAASKDWVWAAAGAIDSRDEAVAGASRVGAGDSPLAQALALVVLAVWGVLLVTRGTFRRLLAWLGALAAIATFITTTLAPRMLTQPLIDEVRSLSGETDVDSGLTAWFIAAVVGAALSVIATALAVRHVREWPEMGTRYDRPGAEPAKSDDSGNNLDLWKAMDEGRDPTA